MTLAFGVDLGGTNVRVALVDTAAGKVSSEIKVKLPATDPDTVVGIIGRTVEQIAAPADAPLGIGVAGMLRGDSGVVENAPNLGWRGVDLRGLLAQRLPGRALGLANDVGAIAWGEFRYGAGRGVQDILCVYAGTGIGGGIIAGGRLVTGASHVAAEVGHTKVVYDETARPCNCGARGCVEAYAGGKKIAERAHAELAAGAVSAAVALAGGDAQKVHAGHLDEAARAGDAYALGLWDEIAPLIGAAIANCVTLLNPARVIIGGTVLWSAVALRERVLTAYERLVNAPAGRACKIVPAELGDEAGILGSATIAVETAA